MAVNVNMLLYNRYKVLAIYQTAVSAQKLAKIKITSSTHFLYRQEIQIFEPHATLWFVFNIV